MELTTKLSLIAIIGIIIGLYFLGSPIQDPNLLLILSIGLLPLLGIFLPILIKKDVNEKLSKYINLQWKRHSKEFNAVTSEMRKELEKKDKLSIDIDLITDKAKELSYISDDIGAHAIDINKSTKFSAYGFLISLIFSIINISAIQPIKFNLENFLITPALIGTISLIIGIYYFIKTTVIWFEINAFEV